MQVVLDAEQVGKEELEEDDVEDGLGDISGYRVSPYAFEMFPGLNRGRSVYDISQQPTPQQNSHPFSVSLQGIMSQDGLSSLADSLQYCVQANQNIRKNQMNTAHGFCVPGESRSFFVQLATYIVPNRLMQRLSPRQT